MWIRTQYIRIFIKTHNPLRHRGHLSYKVLVPLVIVIIIEKS